MVAVKPTLQERPVKMVELPVDIHSQIKSISAGKRMTIREASKEAAEDWIRKNDPRYEKVPQLA